jgi:hypothetical protein
MLQRPSWFNKYGTEPTPILAAMWKYQGYALAFFIFLSFLPRVFHLQEYLFFIMLTVAIGTAWLEQKPIWINSPLDGPLLFYAFWILLTIPFAIDPIYSFVEWRKLIAQVLVFYWTMLVLHRQRNEDITIYILGAVVLGTLFLSSYAVIDFVVQGGTWKDRTYRARAPNSDYNGLSTYLVTSTPVVLAAACTFRARVTRVAAWGTVGLAIVAQAMSYTRAGWLGLAAEALVFSLVTQRRRFAIWTLIGCLGITVAILTTSRFGYQQETVSSENLRIRLVIWERAVQEIAHHPIVGLGYGNDTFSKRFGDIPGIGPAGSHSLFVMVAFGSGIPAVLLLLWIFARAEFTLIGCGKAHLDVNGGILMMGIAMMIIGVAVRDLFDYMFTSKLAYLFWVMIATGISASTTDYFAQTHHRR